MENKFTIEDLIIKIMPGGFLLAIILFLYWDHTQLSLNENLDFFYTFLFFCCSFILGEILQTIAHEIEFITDIFFKFRRPSEIFLYQNNPILKNEYERQEILSKLNLKEDSINIFNTPYSKLSSFWWGENKIKSNDDLSQSIFWKLYSQVSNKEEIKMSNRSYLFTRVMMLEFLLISLILLNKNIQLSVLCFVLFLLFLWRNRGVARVLVFKTVLLNLKEK